ncbi:MAG: threonylcarbamoyl-AMP synthase [Polyangiaceae bacterium]|nr:threonylcarbamoyl-AMP synthase [Polyangiaceae bacterium]
MHTRVLPLVPASLARAVALLRAGSVVAFPTETVYGLGARADDPAAVRRIFEAKGRPATNPLIVHVADATSARELADGFPSAAERLAAAFWPGPLTLVLKRRAGVVADDVVAGGDTVAVRVPASAAARVLLEACRLPLAAPSANRSTTLSPTTAEHVVKSLDGRIPLVLDAGPCARGIESTIVDVTRSPAVLLRPGAISIEALRSCVDIVDPGTIVVSLDKPAPAPGTSSRHYAPRAKLILVAPAALPDELSRRRSSGLSVGAISFMPEHFALPAVEILPDDPDGFAAGLYATLHRLDDAGCSEILMTEPPQTPAWLAVRDRLLRATRSE